MRMQKEKIHNEAIRAVVDCANPTRIMARHMAEKPIVRGSRLSKRETSHPETGRPTRELMGMNSKIVPSSASLRLKFALMVGIREVQVEKQTPERKKKMLK